MLFVRGHRRSASRAGRLGGILAAVAAMFATAISIAPAAGASESENIVPGTYTDTASALSINAATATPETFTLKNTSTTQSSIGSAELTLGSLPFADATLGSVNKSGWSASILNVNGIAVIKLTSASSADGDNDNDDSTAVAPGSSVAVTVNLTAPAGSIAVSSVVKGSGSFTGNDNFTLSKGTADPTVTVSLRSQTITFQPFSGTAVVFGPTYTPSATAPGGTVTFTIDSSSNGACSIPSGSQTISFTGIGTCVIDANQAGNSQYSPAPQVQQKIVVSGASQAIAFTSTPPSPAYVFGTYTPTASTTAGTGAQPVTFTVDGSSTTGACAIPPGTQTVDFNATGTCVIDANEAGNNLYIAATQVQQTFSITGAGQNISFTSTPPAPATVFGPTYTPTASAPGGPVTFSLDSSSSGCTMDPTTSIVSFSAIGTCVIDANQGGDSQYAAAAEAQQSFSVLGASQTINFPAFTGTAIVFGSYTPTASAPGGAVTFTIDGSSSAGACMIPPETQTVDFTGTGSCIVDANQGGDSQYAAATQAQQSITVTGASQTITFNSTPPAPATVFGATYTPTATAPGGTVVFSLDSSSSGCTMAPTTSAVSFTAIGTCVIDANQAGNSQYAAATQAQQSITVTGASQTITFNSTPPVNPVVGGSYSLSANSPGGTVSFSVDGSSSAGACSIPSGTQTVNFTGSGTCIIDGNQAGNSQYIAAPQAQQSLMISAPVLVFTTEPPSSVQQSLPTSNNFTFMCSPVTVQLETSGGAHIASSGVNVTVAVASGSADPGLYYSASPGTTPTAVPASGVTVATNSSGAAVFGTGTSPTCTSGLAAANLGQAFEVSASALGAATVVSTPFAVAQSVTPCPGTCNAPLDTSSSTGTTAQVSATTTGSFTLTTSFGEGDQLNCDSAVSSSQADPFLVLGTGGTSGTTATKTLTMAFPKSVVQSEPIPNSPLMAVCAGANQPFPTWLPYKGSTADPYQGLLFGCSNPLYILLAPLAPLDMCVQSEQKSSADVETVVISITSSTNVDPHAW